MKDPDFAKHLFGTARFTFRELILFLKLVISILDTQLLSPTMARGLFPYIRLSASSIHSDEHLNRGMLADVVVCSFAVSPRFYK